MARREYVADRQRDTHGDRRDIRSRLVIGVRAGEIPLRRVIDPALPEKNSRERRLGPRALDIAQHAGQQRRATHRFGGRQLAGIGARRRLPHARAQGERLVLHCMRMGSSLTECLLGIDCPPALEQETTE